MKKPKAYADLTAAISQAQCAYHALEEGEYSSALRYISLCEQDLKEARRNIEPEITGGCQQ